MQFNASIFIENAKENVLKKYFFLSRSLFFALQRLINATDLEEIQALKKNTKQKPNQKTISNVQKDEPRSYFVFVSLEFALNFVLFHKRLYWISRCRINVVLNNTFKKKNQYYNAKIHNYFSFKFQSSSKRTYQLWRIKRKGIFHATYSTFFIHNPLKKRRRKRRNKIN